MSELNGTYTFLLQLMCFTDVIYAHFYGTILVPVGTFTVKWKIVGTPGK